MIRLVISVLADVNGGCRFVAHAVHSGSGGRLRGARELVFEEGQYR